MFLALFVGLLRPFSSLDCTDNSTMMFARHLVYHAAVSGTYGPVRISYLTTEKMIVLASLGRQ